MLALVTDVALDCPPNLDLHTDSLELRTIGSSLVQRPTSNSAAAVAAGASDSIIRQGPIDPSNSRTGKQSKPGIKKRAAAPSVSGTAKKRKLPGSSTFLEPDISQTSLPQPSSSITTRQDHILVHPSTSVSSPRHSSKSTISATCLQSNSSAHSSSRPMLSHGAPVTSATSGYNSPSAMPCPVLPTASATRQSLLDISQRTSPQVSAAPKSVPGPVISKPAGKRFQKLVVTKRPHALLPTNVQEAPRVPNAAGPPQPARPPVLHHLEFPAPLPAPQLSSISLPPSLTQRKRVQHWAIILSGLSDSERRCCVLVSRMFRYAGDCPILLTSYGRLAHRSLYSVPLGLAYTQATPHWS